MPSLQPLLLEPQAYIDDLTVAINVAKKRIFINSLIIADDHTTHQLIEALKSAAKRGIKVVIVADSFTFSEFGGHFNPFKRSAKRSQAARLTSELLIKSGISFTWLDDHFKANPFAGVTHTKWSVVDDICYTFGGVNLYVDGVSSTDYMFKMTDAVLAKELITQQMAIVANPTPTYTGFQGSCPLGPWYIDSGLPGDSLIYDRAIDLAKDAESIIYVSQYSPTGPLAKILKQKNAACYYNQPENASFPTNVLLRYDRLTSRVPSQYPRKKHLHAKFIIFTMPDGKKIALTGSHNFSYKGVTFGTREIALESTNTTVVSQLESFFASNIH
jgi:cardiolipin synthase